MITYCQSWQECQNSTRHQGKKPLDCSPSQDLVLRIQQEHSAPPSQTAPMRSGPVSLQPRRSPHHPAANSLLNDSEVFHSLKKAQFIRAVHRRHILFEIQPIVRRQKGFYPQNQLLLQIERRIPISYRGIHYVIERFEWHPFPTRPSVYAREKCTHQCLRGGMTTRCRRPHLSAQSRAI